MLTFLSCRIGGYSERFICEKHPIIWTCVQEGLAGRMLNKTITHRSNLRGHNVVIKGMICNLRAQSLTLWL